MAVLVGQYSSPNIEMVKWASSGRTDVIVVIFDYTRSFKKERTNDEKLKEEEEQQQQQI